MVGMELEWNLVLPSLLFTLSNQYWKGIRISKTYRSQLKNYYDSQQCPLIEKNSLCSRFRDKWLDIIPTFLWIHSNFESIPSDCKVVRFSSRSIQSCIMSTFWRGVWGYLCPVYVVMFAQESVWFYLDRVNDGTNGPPPHLAGLVPESWSAQRPIFLIIHVNS